MKIPRSYRYTKAIGDYLAQIMANKEVINAVKVPIEIENNIRRQSILGSALFSARIEGNSLTRMQISSFSDLSRKDQNRVEVANLDRAITFVLREFVNNKNITSKSLLKLHKMAMKNILFGSYLGHYRTEHEGVFDSAGNAIYHSPPPSMIDGLINDLVKYANSNKEKIVPIRAALCHLAFEDIHPLVDGNGRVGRLLQLAVLNRGGYGMKGLTSIEELIDGNRQEYYYAIEDSRENGDATMFVEFILKLLAQASGKSKDILLEKQNYNIPVDTLPPRRREIFEIINDQKMVSLDFLHRRFLRISPRVLSYDLHQLSKLGLIQKLGKTRGALYASK